MRNPRLFSLLSLSVLLVANSSAVLAQGTRSSRGSLSSRGASSVRALPALRSVAGKSVKTEDQLVMGRVGVVRVESVTIRKGRTPGDKPIAIVKQGVNLAVLMEKDGYYGVLMQDSTLGWVMTGAVEMLDYQVQVKLGKNVVVPQDTAPVPQPEAQSAPQVQTNDPRTEALIREAFTYIGVPYVWAGNTRRGLDCSAFVKSVFAKSRGIALPRVSADQARVGMPIASTDDLIAGDRLYFDMGRKGRVSHTGIYIGNGYFIHASSNRHCVGVDKLASGNYWKCLVAARRDP